MRELFQRDLAYLVGELPPEDLSAGGSVALAHLAGGHRLFDQGRFEDALALYATADAALRIVSGTVGGPPRLTLEAAIATSMADCHANLGDFDLAVAATDTALERLGSAGHLWQRCRRQLLVSDRRAFYLAWMGRCDAALFESDAVVGALRDLANENTELRADLARSLDHRAEILERAHRQEEAAVAAEESTNIRRELSLQDPLRRISFLRSLVTYARIVGNLGDAGKAVAICTEAADTVAKVGNAVPQDLRAQIATCHGRNLLQCGRDIEGMNQLHEGLTLLRQLALQSGGASVFRDAYSEVLMDLGRSRLGKPDATAGRSLIRAAAQKRRIARQDDHPLHWASLAEALIELGTARGTEGRHAIAARHYLEALAVLEHQDILPGGLPEMALSLSQGLVKSMDAGVASACFPRLAKLLIRGSEIVSDASRGLAKPRVSTFNRFWATHFLEHDRPEELLQLLSFTHGRRLAVLAQAEIEARVRAGIALQDEREFFDLRRTIHRLDLEMADIVSARSPSLVGKDSVDLDGNPAVSDGRATARAGDDLRAQRDALFRRYVTARDHLISTHQFPDPTARLVDPNDLKIHAVAGKALGVWFVPAVFGINRAPILILIPPGANVCLSVEFPQLPAAGDAFARLLASRRFGRSATRGTVGTVTQARVLSAPAGLESSLWQQMTLIWEPLATVLVTRGIEQLDMITHADAHNLPWFGSCPESLQLRQFPSLNFFVRQADKREAITPSPETPLVLLVDDGHDDPLNFLYHVPLEVEAIRQAWPNAVIDAATTATSNNVNAAAVWIIGHGLTDGGQPLLKRRSCRQALATIGPLQQADLRVGLIYASTCYLGQTADVRAEPVGLPSMAALRMEAPYAAGAVAPIDDLGAALMALLFHHFWREKGDARVAFDQARRVMRTGLWPLTALDALASATRTRGQQIIASAKTDATISMARVAEISPEFSPALQLAHQHRIRRRGRACLETWVGFEDTPRWLAGLHAKPATHARLVSTARFLNWFG